MDLLELRKEIDRIDDQLIPLLMARMDVSEQVAKYKVERGISTMWQASAAIGAKRSRPCLLLLWTPPVRSSTR